MTADSRLAILYSCAIDPDGRLRIERLGQLDNSHENQHERGRPAMLGRGTPTAPQHLVSPGHEREETDRRFARELRIWLEPAAKEPRMGRLCVLAPPRLLGVLRRELSADTVDLVDANLTHLSTHELESHPTVLGAVSNS